MPEIGTEDFVDGFPRNSSDDQLNRGPENYLRYEHYRLETFDNWPVTANVDKYSLAKNGFCYLGDGDRVKCIFCNIILKKWVRGDSVVAEHKKHAPNCPFIVNAETAGNIPHQEDVRSNNRPIDPKHSEYKSREIRLKSFLGWPSDKKQKPEDLACAGFFYLGTGDSVKCFHCGGLLRYWDDPDVPWEEHKRWFPACPFITENGQDCQQALKKQRTETYRMIARRNGYTEDLLNIHKEYVIRNGFPCPERYEDLVDELEQLRVSQETEPSTMGATGYTPGQPPVTSETPVQDQKSKGKRPDYKTQKSAIQANWITDERFQCKICLDNPVEVLFLPCKHVCCCQNCSNKLKVKVCPICRGKIKAIQPLYFA